MPKPQSMARGARLRALARASPMLIESVVATPLMSELKVNEALGGAGKPHDEEHHRSVGGGS
jgi:hypothetical protein